MILEYNLQFFADGPGGEKTEPATQKKLKLCVLIAPFLIGLYKPFY